MLSRRNKKTNTRKPRFGQLETLESKRLFAGDLVAGDLVAGDLAGRVDFVDTPSRPEPMTEAEIRSTLPDVFLPGDRDTGGAGAQGGGGTVVIGDRDPTGAGQLEEVDVAHIGGSPHAGQGAYLVTAVGTGGKARLASWRLTASDPSPIELKRSDVIDGHRLKLHVLAPELSPKLQRERFLAGYIGNNGNLWLKSSSADGGGDISFHHELGFGSNVGVDVRDYAIAHQPQASNASSIRVVTPMVTETPSGTVGLRVVTWDVNTSTGKITGLHDSGDLGVTDIAKTNPQMTVSHQSGNNYAVSYRSISGKLVNRTYFVWGSGAISTMGGEKSGFDLRMDDPVVKNADDVVAVGLGTNGVVTATIDDGDVTISVWDRQIGESDSDGLWEPSLVSDNTFDEAPHKKGVLIDSPELSHVSQRLGEESSQFFGFAVATGDFNNDGYEDAVISAPNKDYDGTANVGSVRVIFGGPDGLSHHDESWSQADTLVQGTPDAHDEFGYSVASGDFNGDGWDDLAIGVRGESIESESVPRAGAVNILYGTNSGLDDGPAGYVNIIRQGDGLQGTPEAFDRLGWSLATGDFNNDGRDDLAIGVPYEDVGSVSNAGAVNVVFGSATKGLNLNTDLIFTQADFGFGVEKDDFFGMSLAVGDFDGNGRDDLVIGSPGESIGDIEDAGGAMILYSTNAGLGAQHDFVSQDEFQQSDDDVHGEPEAGDMFGDSLTVGDFDGDGKKDLAVGAPGENDGDGQVHLFFGSKDGLGAADQQSWLQGGSIPFMNDPQFGSVLTAGDFDNDNRDDLAIGTPALDVDGKTNAGGVIVIRNLHEGVFGADVKQIHQSSDGAPGSAQAGDWYGGALAAGDFNADGNSDLLIGVPYEDDGDVTSSGYVNALYGRVGNDFSTTDNDGFGNAEVWGTRALLTDATKELNGIGSGELFSTAPSGEKELVHAASVTKNMTLLLAVNAIEAGHVSLNDQVEISALAAGTGGSNVESPDDPDTPLFQEGDRVSLRDLLYGMMLRSGNKASVAIAEHVFGDADDFVDAMNTKADGLGMDDSTFGHPAGGWVTSPQDMTTLWMEGVEHPLFKSIASANSRTGTLDRDGEIIEFPMQKFGTGGAYPGLGGWKGGNGGLWFGNDYPNTGWCTSCLTAEATRLDRSLIVSLQQSGDRWDDAKELFDYGFRTLFTPDNRGHNTYPESNINDITTVPRMGAIYDFASDVVTDGLVVTAVVDNDDKLLLEAWSVSAGLGMVESAGDTLVTIKDVPAGHLDVQPDVIEFGDLGGVGDQIADYVSVHLDDGKVRLDLWTVGSNRLEPGDVNGDGFVGPKDIALLQREINHGRGDLEFDLNLDGVIDLDDVRHIVEDLLKTEMGDANLDGRVDSQDLNVVGRNWQKEVRGWSAGDFDGNGRVDSTDLNLLGRNWQSGVGRSAVHDAVMAEAGTSERVPRSPLAEFAGTQESTATGRESSAMNETWRRPQTAQRDRTLTRRGVERDLVAVDAVMGDLVLNVWSELT